MADYITYLTANGYSYMYLIHVTVNFIKYSGIPDC